MNIFLRELTNRLISYLIRISKGETNLEKLEHLLKKVLLFSLMMLLLATTMTGKYIVVGWSMYDLEKSVDKIDTFMGTQQENMTQLFRINSDQYVEIQKITKENKEYRTDIKLALEENMRLKEELNKLKKK